MKYQSFVEFSIFISIFYIFFSLFFRENRDFKFSRRFIFGSVLLSLIIPLLPKFNLLNLPDTGLVGILLAPIEIMESNLSAETSPHRAPFLDKQVLFMFLYCMVSILLSIRFLTGYLKIKALIKSGKKSQRKNFTLVANHDVKTSFSFFNYVVIPADLIAQEDKLELIIKHELLHRDLGHSAEKLCFNVIKIIFWWHPIIHLMQKDLSIVHEYEVDAAMIDNNSVKSYSLFLVDQIEHKNNLLINTISSHIKKRILMMYNSNNKMKTIKKWSIALFACLSIFIIHACQNEILDDNKLVNERTVNKVDIKKTNDNDVFESTIVDTVITFDMETKTERQKIVSTKRTVYKSPDKLPRVAGCENEGTQEEIKACATQKLLQFIYKNISYPSQAKDNQVEGMSVIQFIVSNKGEIYNPKIVRSLGYGTDETILQMMELMKKELGPWIPGVKNNKTVDVQYTLPIKFKLEG